MKTIYIPRDSSALSVGAEEVAVAVAKEAVGRGGYCSIVPTGARGAMWVATPLRGGVGGNPVALLAGGSRGAMWLEPLVEVEIGGTRLAYGPVEPQDVPSLFDAGFLEGKHEHPLALGPTEEIPFLKNQERLTFVRCGVIDPLSIPDYRAHGGFDGLTKALGMTGGDVVAQVIES